MARSVEEELDEDDPADFGAALTGGVRNVTDLAKQAASGIGKIDDVTKAGLVGFAVRMLSGGWGTGAQKLAGAIGAGAESAGAQEAIQKTEAEKEKDRKSREGIAAEGRASREEIQAMKDETTRAITTEKIAGAFERQKLRSGGARTPDELKYLMAAEKRLQSSIDKDLKGLTLTPDQKAEWVRMKADEELEAARRSGRFGEGGGGKKPAASEEEVPSTTPGATPPAGTKPKSSAATPAPAKPSGPPVPFADLKKQPDFDRLFADPAQRRALQKKGYSLQEIEAEEAARGLDPADRLSQLKKFLSPRTDRKLPKSE